MKHRFSAVTICPGVAAAAILAALSLAATAASADDKKPATGPPQHIGPMEPGISLQQTKTWIKCFVYAQAGNPPSTRLDFLNDTGKTLPAGTRVEWQVSGTPASCCKGSLTLPLTRPGDHPVFNNVLNPPQSHGVPCKAWVVIPAYGADYMPSGVPALTPNRTVTVHVSVRNQSGRTWPANGLFRLSYHWYQGANLVVFDGQRTTFPSAVETGQLLGLTATLIAPNAPGNYTLKWDMVEEGVAWFSNKGVPTKNQNVTVAP